MISRRHRFHGLNSLRVVYKNGQTKRTQHLALRYNLNSRRQTYRCAVVVSKKVDKSAVRRNRIRRRVFESVRSLESKIKQPYDLVISVFSIEVAELPTDKLQQQVRELLKSSGVIDD